MIPAALGIACVHAATVTSVFQIEVDTEAQGFRITAGGDVLAESWTPIESDREGIASMLPEPTLY